MKVTCERLPGSTARLEIEVDQESMDREMERAYRRLSNRVLIPGFRRGKAPRVLVERALGEGAVLQEATKELVPRMITEALEQQSLEPVGEPEGFELLSAEPFRFEVKVPLVPTVELGDYAAVRVEREPVEVTEEDVEATIQQLLQQSSEWVEPETPRAAQEGDQLVIDIQDFVDNEPVGEKQEDVTVVLGKGPLIEALDRQLVGAEAGGDYEFEATLPEDHRVADMSGKPARFKVHVKSIREKRVPTLDDEFVQGLGRDVSSVQELREQIAADMQRQAESEERTQVINQIIDEVVSRSTVEVPEVLVEREIDHQIEHMSSDLESQNLKLDQYLRFTNRTGGQLREELREGAEKRLIRGLVLSEVARAEQISVDEADIDAELARMLGRIDESEHEAARELFGSENLRGRIRSDLFDRKLLNRLSELAVGEALYPEPVEDEPAQVDGAAETSAEDAQTSEADPSGPEAAVSIDSHQQPQDAD